MSLIEAEDTEVVVATVFALKVSKALATFNARNHDHFV